MLDELQLQMNQAAPPEDAQWPEGWTVTSMEHIHFFNVAGPPWAALDYQLNAGAVMDDGAWELMVDKCVPAASFEYQPAPFNGEWKPHPWLQQNCVPWDLDFSGV